MVNYEKYGNINWKECYKYYINIDFDCILKIKDRVILLNYEKYGNINWDEWLRILYRRGYLRLIKSESPHDEL